MTRNFGKGSSIYQAGGNANRVYLIQSGLVSIGCLDSTGAVVELYQAVAPQLIGIEALQGQESYSTFAIAVNETSAVEMTSEEAKAHLSSGPPILKLLSQALASKFTTISQGIQSIRLENQAIPCPPELITKLFATLFHVASYTGQKTEEVTRVNWPAFKKYCHRVFLESPVRLEQAIYLLSLLGQAELEMVKDDTDPDPEAPEQLGFVRFRNLKPLLEFSEFFRARTKAQGGARALSSDDGLGTVSPLYGDILREVRKWNAQKFVDGAPNPALTLNIKKKKAS